MNGSTPARVNVTLASEGTVRPSSVLSLGVASLPGRSLPGALIARYEFSTRSSS